MVTASWRAVHELQGQPNGLSAVILGIHEWAARHGVEHYHIGAWPGRDLPLHSARWQIAARVPSDLYQVLNTRIFPDIAWPSLHGMPIDIDSSHVLAMQRAAEPMAHAIAAVSGAPGAQIWLHDYQVASVLPPLRPLVPHSKIGYFQHAPVAPCYAGATLLSHLRRWVKDADVVAVQTAEDRYAMLNSSPRLRSVVAPVCSPPLGPRQDGISAWPTDVTGARVAIIGRLDPAKGHATGMYAVGYAVLRTRLQVHLFVQATPGRQESASYYRLTRSLESAGAAVEVMLARHSGSLNVNTKILPLSSLRATMAEADFLLVPSLAEGMSLVAKEFALLHERDSAGVIILTPRVGSRASLPGAIVSRGHSAEHIADCLAGALELSLEERRRRAALNFRAVQAESFDNWIENLIALLEPYDDVDRPHQRQ